MEWHEIQAFGRHTVKFADLPYMPLTSPIQSPETRESFVGEKIGGILRHGEWGWQARNSVLQIVSLRNGRIISNYEFCESRGYESCCIKYVEELFPNNPEAMLLAVILESFRGLSGGCSYVAIYSVELSSVLSNIELSLHLTCASFMDSRACRRSLLQNFDGCLAVGSEEGVIVLLDLNVRKLMAKNNEQPKDEFLQCHIVDYSLPLTDIHRNFRQCQQDGIYLGLQLEVIESPCSIKCILPIDLILGFAIGLEDGRMALYDLTELQIFFIALPNPEVTMSALVKMDYLEPPDDPRPCLYIWTLHENGENLHAVLHSLMYEKRFIEDDESFTYFESFQTGSVRLQLPLEATKSIVLSCQAISTFPTHGEDDSNSLCAITWLSVLEEKNKLLIFDLNQWYKEEMPLLLEYGKQPNYLAGYILNGECTGLHTLLNPNNIAHFNSMQRFEEHFYPNSLSFDVLLLHTEGLRRYNWEGAQNRVINLLRSSNAAIFLEPNSYFNEILRTGLMPQFMDLNINSTFSRNAKYNILLSVALEHNCVSLLRDCAKSWLDGSFMCSFAASTGLSLSTLTEWIWKRATCIKSRCNDLCKSLFEFGGYPLDNREQKELCFITRQLKTLSDLLKEILVSAKKQIPERVWSDLENRYSSLSMASSYQDILLWLLNIGLLPEASPGKIIAGNDLIPYPYKELNEFYNNKRLCFAKINKTFISKKSGSCKLLFIDSFIEHVCKGNILQEYWLENEGNGLYPPNSLEAMLRVMLVPDLDYNNKCAILLYFFLDLNMTIDEDVYKDVVANFIKFPSVFKLSASLIKTVQSFWNLDHDQYLPAVDEFISPFNKNQCYMQWQVDLVIEVFLNQNASNLALRVLESQPSLISPLLKLKTLLANQLISEAFHFVRSKTDDTLLETFFTCCLRNGQFGVIRDLALSEREGLILQKILKNSKFPGAESLHFVYLLQKSKYIEAVSYMDELSNKAKNIKSSLHSASQMNNTPNLVLSAFNTTMTPVTQGLTDVYFRIKNKIKKKDVDNKSPVPLSCQLIKQNANNLLGGIYHSSALSAHFATYYWGEMEEQTKQAKHLLNSNNAPFLRRPQIDTSRIDYFAKSNISYPQPYKAAEKRTLYQSGVLENEHDKFEREKIELKLNPKKRRRLIGQDIVNELSQFVKMDKISKTLPSAEFTFGQEETREPLEQTNKNSIDVLTKPVRPAKDIEDPAISGLEIHGILKTHTPEPGQEQRVTQVEEEKNLRFILPSADPNSTQVLEDTGKEDDSIQHMEIRGEEQRMEIIEKQTTFTSSPKTKQITRAISEESNQSSTSSSSISEDNFYSPVSSKNSSKLDYSNLSRYSIMSGPQPRKPLARFSAEHSEKSLTPEPETKTTNSSSPNITDLVYATALNSSFKSKISARISSEQLSADHMQKTISAVDKETSTSACNTTTTETLSKSMTLASNLKEVGQVTSGFGNITSFTTFTGSKINDFYPKFSSSKVGTSLKIGKISECSTVLGSLTTFECTSTGSNNAFATPSMPLNKSELNADSEKPMEDVKRQMLETTLSMSTCDFSILESTSMQQTKTPLTATAKDAPSKLATPESEENNKTEPEETTSIEPLQECKDYLKQEKEIESQTQGQIKSNVFDYNEESNNDCIVLSTSSSSSSPSEQQEQDDYEMDDYGIDDYGMDEVDNEDNLEDDGNSEYKENKDNDMFNYDDDNEDNKEELSTNETDTSKNTENDDIQLIEDSSSDIDQQQTLYYDESDSDDVKVVEDENVEMYDSKAKVCKPIETTASTEKIANVNEAEFEKHTGEDITSSQGNKFEKEDSNSREIPKQMSVSGNYPSEIVVISEIITDYKLKSLKREDSESNRINAAPAEPDTESSRAEDNIKPDEVFKKIEGNVVNSIDESEDKIEKHSEIITTNEEKSDLIVDTEVIKTQSEKEEIPKMEKIKDDSIEMTSDKIENVSKVNKEKQEQQELTLKEIADHSELTSTSYKQSLKSIAKEERVVVIKGKREKSKVGEVQGDSTSITPQRKLRTLRESSVPPEDSEHYRTDSSNEKSDKNLSILTPQKQRALRGSSISIDLSSPSKFSSSRRNARGTSVPPQTIVESEEVSNITPRIRRIMRSSSLQPNYKMEDIERATHSKDLKIHNIENPEAEGEKNISSGKILTRRRSALLDSINELRATPDSPSARTRLRSRLSSMDSELDSSIVSGTDQLVQPKRTRKISTSNKSAEKSLTPKRTRRNSITSRPETSFVDSSPHTQRARSVLSVQEEDTESVPDSPKATSRKILCMKRRKTFSEELDTEEGERIAQASPQSDQSVVSEVSYSSSRRLTRTQLAIMQKSAVLTQTSTKVAVAKESGAISPPLNKRIAKSRSTRSSNVNADSDDTESVSSKVSTVSSITGTKRRVTRSTIKEKDDIDDDVASVASSFGSEKHQRLRRSKDKSSPNTTLTVIPEEAPIETKKRRRPSKQ